METAVSDDLAITAAWENLSEGEPEERACFASIGIRFDKTWLTEAHDSYVNRIRTAPLLSSYHLAQWLAWHWWRLRWEPHAHRENWAFAHRLSTIGEGYIWPNVTIFSDGEQTALITKPTTERPNTPLRYISDIAAIVPARGFEEAVDDFVEQVRGQLRAEKIQETNLDLIWDDVRGERKDSQKARYRKIEALLGFDPDEADETIIKKILNDAKDVGESGMEEVAADTAQGGKPLTVESLRALAAKSGFDTTLKNIVQIPQKAILPKAAETPAWKLGSMLADILRGNERLGSEPIEDSTLTELAAVPKRIIDDCPAGGTISFAIDTSAASGKVVLRSKFREGRRFELARILADRIGFMTPGKLFPATRAYTYRQKLQRAFAAEFLSPFASVDEMLDGDYSMEKQRDVAEHFGVSEMTVRTLLVNNHRLDREELEAEFDAASAA